MTQLSVIMTVKDNENNYIQCSINSILNQSYKNFELIIVADGSNSETITLLKEYQANNKNIFIIIQKNVGITKSLNRAIESAKSDLIIRHDYDDISAPNRFEHLVNYMNNNQDTVICGSNCFKINMNNKKIGIIRTITNSKKLNRKLRYYNPIVHPSVIFRKKQIKNIGCYNEKFFVSQDYELWVRSSKLYKISNIDKYLYSLRIHKNSISYKKNYQQRINTFYINLFKEFPDFKINEFLNISPTDLINLIDQSDIKLVSFINSRVYVLFYDKVRIFKIFKYDLSTILKIFDYYINRPKYLYYRLRHY